MGLSSVNTEIRYLEPSGEWGIDDMDFDVAYAKIHHEYAPSRNYCTVEFKIPTIEKEFPESYVREVEDTYHYPHLHRMKYLEVDNHRFHGFMKTEGLDTFDKIRYRVGDHLITYYMSSHRTLGYLEHDYMMAIMLYINHPKRNFTRRTPCKKLDPRCIPGCLDVLKEPIVSWVFDEEPYTARVEKYFFTPIGETHRLCIGYTIEDIKSNETCFEPKEPRYFIIDLEAKYFKEAIWEKSEWENAIMRTRRAEDKDMFAIYDSGPEPRMDGGDLECGTVSFRGYGGSITTAIYNYKRKENVPLSLHNALSTNNFEQLQIFDLLVANSRNSAHKWIFNHWQDTCNYASNGWWCAWDVSETISASGDTAAGLGDSTGQVEAQLNQVANVVGWGVSGDTSSTDTEYWMVFPKYDGYEYEHHFEPLPDRGGGMF